MRRPSEFQALRERGNSRTHLLVVLRFTPNGLPHARFGFIVGRSVAKQAVARNRLRRRMREVARRTPVKPGWDLLFIARSRAAGAAFDDLRAAMRDLERRAGLLAEPAAEVTVEGVS